jgi:thioester reductase-like protein
MLRQAANVNNALIQLIVDGRIRTLEDLRATYHKLAMQTHPDSVGSDRLVRKFLEFSDQYEEAKAFLAQSLKEHNQSAEPSATNHRLEFYKELHSIESMEMPYAFHSDENQESIRVAKQLAIAALSQ